MVTTRLGRFFPKIVSLAIAALACALGTATPARAVLTPVVTETGKIFFSIDGLGTNDPAGGTIDVEKPAGATVRKAFFSCAAVPSFVIPDGGVTVNGAPVNWDMNIANGIFSSNTFADVTTLVGPTIDGAAAGRIPFTVIELNPPSVDGCALGVVFDDASQTKDSTVIVSFGGQATAGDNFSITLAEPLDLSDPASRADMGLAISFSAQDQSGLGGSHLCGEQSAMDSQIDVNGQRLTSCAGNLDDGVGPVGNGLLFTVGGLDDTNDNPADPFQRAADGGQPRVTDDELYNLKPFVNTGDTLISVDTINPSADDNIFLAYFLTSVPSILEGIVLGPSNVTNPVGAEHTVTATVVDNRGQPVVGRQVNFEILSGPQAGLTGSGTTDSNGQATFTYTGTAAGVDMIVASFVDASGVTQMSNVVSKEWIQACGNGVLEPGEQCDDGNTVDGDGCSSSCEIENQPPDCSGAAASVEELWPPNHQFVPVSVVGVTDPDGDPVAITITDIAQDEPLNTVGDGNTCPDGDGVGTSTALLRAERSGTPKAPGDGRVYHVGFTASDGKGGECSGTVNVCVPHDQGRGHACVDEGPQMNSTGPCR